MITYDLFAGAGGGSEGLIAASHILTGKRPSDLAAVNHWPVAIATHKKNHPWARHYCEDIRRIDPRKAMGFDSAGYHGKRSVDIGIGAPDCGHFSGARGGKPCDDGIRALAWDVSRWARLLDTKKLLIENVREFLGYGPLYPADHDNPKLRNRPIPERKGEYFREFVATLRRLGYDVDWRLLQACDYGDPTSRTRLFIQAKANGKKIAWPEISHGVSGGNLFDLPPYRTARECIDFDIPGESIFGRARPLVDSTMARIAEGIGEYCGDPFMVGIGGPRGRQVVTSLDKPLRTILTHNHTYLCTPFLIRYNGGGRVQSLDEPLTTLDTSNRFGLCQAFLINYYGNGRALDIDKPLPTLTTHDRFGLIRVQSELRERGLVIADITLRMLLPHEQAAAHSFPEGYTFEGTQGQKTEQIGHSWPIQMATAVCRSLIDDGGMS